MLYNSVVFFVLQKKKQPFTTMNYELSTINYQLPIIIVFFQNSKTITLLFIGEIFVNYPLSKQELNHLFTTKCLKSQNYQ